MRQIYIFKTRELLQPDDMAKKRESIRQQVENGLVVLDNNIDFITCLVQPEEYEVELEAQKAKL